MVSLVGFSLLTYAGVICAYRSYDRNSTLFMFASVVFMLLSVLVFINSRNDPLAPTIEAMFPIPQPPALPFFGGLIHVLTVLLWVLGPITGFMFYDYVRWMSEGKKG